VNTKKLPAYFLRLLREVKAKRPRTVIEHLLEHGQVTTEELREKYGYNHPPRAVRDVRELEIPIETFRVSGADGRKIAAYKFGDPRKILTARLSGRTAFSVKLKAVLIEKYGARCNLYLESFPDRELQIDHRIPFAILGDSANLPEDPDAYMLLCASANRTKSWSCEHCENWERKEAKNCRSCYWAFPEGYSHIAMRDIRRLDIMWSGHETADYDHLKARAAKTGKALPDYVKDVLRAHFNQKGKSG